jgi:hypothetical protein
MDNILKIVLGVVAFVGLIIMMIPNGNPLQDKGPNATVAANTMADPDAGKGKADEQVAPSEAPAPPPSSPSPTQDIAFGQPMLDPTPPSMQNQQQPQQGQNSGSPDDPAPNEATAPFPYVPTYGQPPVYQYGPPPIPTQPYQN